MENAVWHYAITGPNFERLKNAGGVYAGENGPLTVVANADGIAVISMPPSLCDDHPTLRTAPNGRPFKVVRLVNYISVAATDRFDVEVVELIFHPDNPPLQLQPADISFRSRPAHTRIY